MNKSEVYKSVKFYICTRPRNHPQMKTQSTAGTLGGLLIPLPASSLPQRGRRFHLRHRRFTLPVVELHGRESFVSGSLPIPVCVRFCTVLRVSSCPSCYMAE